MEYQIKKILMATDFTSSANNALQVAVAIAARQNAKLILLHVISPIYIGRPFGLNTIYSKANENQIAQAYEVLNEIKTVILRECNKLNIAVYATIGTVSRAVNEFEMNEDVDLIVIGKKDTSENELVFIGSNAYNIIKEATCPVLTIPEMFKKMTFKSVLYPIRNSPGMVEKFDYIKPIVEKNHSNIHLLGIVESLEKEELRTIENKMKEVFLVMNEIKGEISYANTLGQKLAEEIIKFANERKDDLLVLNATLEKNWYQFFTGTFTQKILANAQIPVLTIKPNLTPNTIKMAEQQIAAQAQKYVPFTMSHFSK